MNKAFHEGYMYKQAKGPPALPVKPQVKPPALPKFDPSQANRYYNNPGKPFLDAPLTNAHRQSGEAFRSAAGSAKPVLAAQAKPGLVRSAPAVKGLPAIPDTILRKSPTITPAAQAAARGSRLARLGYSLKGLMGGPVGIAAEAAMYGGEKYKNYLDEDEADFNREQDLKYERIRQLTGDERRLGPHGAEYRAQQPVQYGSHEHLSAGRTPSGRVAASAEHPRVKR